MTARCQCVSDTGSETARCLSSDSEMTENGAKKGKRECLERNLFKCQCVAQIPHTLSWNWTTACALKRGRLTTWNEALRGARITWMYTFLVRYRYWHLLRRTPLTLTVSVAVYYLTLCMKYTDSVKKSVISEWATFIRRSVYKKPEVKFMNKYNKLNTKE